MSDAPVTTAILLPRPMPACPHARLALAALRRMGAHGLSDARVAHAFFTAFGQGFRRPLLLARALVADLAATATGPIQLAPCCCARMTASEGAFVGALARVEREPDAAHLLLADLTGTRLVDGLLASAAALAAAFADAGRPIGA